ncbi:MAG: hypothetical protein H6599_03400 [Flavobacteriales bacterium]|nr:hypothetical protein [Flavobacteriales bacterium]
MNKSKVYIIIIILLLICNGLLSFFLFSKPLPPGPPPFKSPKEVIAKELHFSQQQISEYNVLIKAHQSEIKNIDEELRLLKDSLFTSILKDNSELAAEEVADKIAQTQKKIELLHVQHLMAIKDMCTTEQKVLFDDLVKDFGKIFRPHPPKKK